MTEKVVSIDKGKRKWSQFTIVVDFIDGTSEEQKCSFFGSSFDFPEFLMFLDGDPELEGQYPTHLIHTSQIKMVRLINIEEVSE